MIFTLFCKNQKHAKNVDFPGGTKGERKSYNFVTFQNYGMMNGDVLVQRLSLFIITLFNYLFLMNYE